MDGTDKISAIENIVGSNHDDTIVGNASQNFLSGEDGADTILGGDNPNNLLSGGRWPGDIIHGDGGSDPILDGGPGNYDQVLGDDVSGTDNDGGRLGLGSREA